MNKQYKILFLLVSVIVGSAIIGSVLVYVPRAIFPMRQTGLMVQFASTLNEVGNYIVLPIAYVFQFAIICLAIWVVFMLRHKIRSAVWKVKSHTTNPTEHR